MVPHWFRSPKALILIPILLLLLGAVACGTAEPDTAAPADTQAKDTAKTDTKMDTKTDTMKDTKTDTMKDTKNDVPVAKAEPTAMPATTGKKLEELAIAVSPLGWDTNYSYKVTTSGLLDKRPVLEWLVGVDPKTGAYIPELATSWDMSPDGRTWTVKLREGVKWQAGPHSPPEGWGDFSGADVKHSFWLLINPDSKASGISTWRKITGAKKGMDLADTEAVIDKMVAIKDPTTIEITTGAVYPEMAFFISHIRNLPMESKARWDAIGDEGYGDAIVGTGPFKFIERIEGVHVLYEAVPDHWRHTPDYNQLRFRWVQEPATRLADLLTEQVHLSDIERDARPAALKKGMKVISSTQPSMFHKWFFGGLWWTEPDKLDETLPFLDVKVRQAMNKAINRQAIADALLGGSLVRMPGSTQYGFDELDEAIWPGVINPKWAEDWDEYYAYDPEKARALLKEAGYENGFEYTMYLFTQAGLPEMVDIGQAMALDFAEVGITTNLVPLEYSKVRSYYRGQSSEILGSLWPSRSQHRANYNLLGRATPSTTTHNFQRQDVDDLLAKLDVTLDTEERAKILRQYGDIQFYDFSLIQMFALFAEITYNPKYVATYDFSGMYSGYYGSLEYVDTIPQ